MKLLRSRHVVISALFGLAIIFCLWGLWRNPVAHPLLSDSPKRVSGVATINLYRRQDKIPIRLRATFSTPGQDGDAIRRRLVAAFQKLNLEDGVELRVSLGVGTERDVMIKRIDGVNCVRVTSKGGNGNVVVLLNAEGVFYQQANGDVIRADFLRSSLATLAGDLGQEVSRNNAPAQYSSQLIHLEDGIPYEQVLYAMSDAQITMFQTMAQTRPSASGSLGVADYVSTLMPVQTAYFIDPESGELLGQAGLDRDGAPVGSAISYLKPSAPISSNLFAISDSSKVIVARTPQDIAEAMRTSSTKFYGSQ